MDNRKDFVRRFIEIYSAQAISVFDSYYQIYNFVYYDTFYDKTSQKVSEIVEMTPEEIRNLSKPFHWVLFNSDSPFLKYDSKNAITQLRPLDKSELVRAVSEDYSAYLDEKFRRMFNEHLPEIKAYVDLANQ